jgi:hypothetical protein
MQEAQALKPGQKVRVSYDPRPLASVVDAAWMH